MSLNPVTPQEMHVERVEAGPHQALAAVACPGQLAVLPLLAAAARPGHLVVPAIAGAFARTHLATVARPVSVAAVAPAAVSLGVARPVSQSLSHLLWLSLAWLQLLECC